MAPSLRLDYELTAADVAAGVDALVAPDARVMSWRPALLRLVWLLLAVAAALLFFVEASFWRRLHHLGMPFRFVAPWYRAAILGLPALWAALLGATAMLSRDPDGALRWLRARLVRKLLASRAPGPRTLSLTPEGLEVEAGGQKAFRAWTAVRRARRGERHLVLDARDLWFIVPLHALSSADRDALLLEVSARLPMAV
jgi:hypothetical protein